MLLSILEQWLKLILTGVPAYGEHDLLFKKLKKYWPYLLI